MEAVKTFPDELQKSIEALESADRWWQRSSQQYKDMQEMVQEMAEARGAEMFVPDRRFCMDNGAMIAWLGSEMYSSGVRMDVSETAVRQRFRTDEVEVSWRS